MKDTTIKLGKMVQLIERDKLLTIIYDNVDKQDVVVDNSFVIDTIDNLPF